MGVAIIFFMYMLQAFFDKSASKLSCNTGSTISYGVVKSLISSIIALVAVLFSGFEPITVPALIISLLAGISQAVCTVFILLSLQKYSIMQVNLFMTASVLIPTVFGFFLFDEKPTVIKILLIFVIIYAASLILGIRSFKELKLGGKNFALLIIVWLFYGGIMLAQKMYGYYLPESNPSVFSLYMYLISFISLSLVSGLRLRKEKFSLPKGKLLVVCIVTAAVVFVMNQTLTVLSATMPSYILFPITNGGKLVFVLLISAVVFKEKPTFKMILGCVIMLTAVLLL